MIGPCGSKQQRLGAGVPALPLGAEQQGADRLCAGRSTGFAGHNASNAALFKRSRKQPGLGAFPRPLPAFECDELAPCHSRSPSRQSMFLSISPAASTDILAIKGRYQAGLG